MVINIIAMMAIIWIPFTSTHGNPSVKNQFIEFASLFTCVMSPPVCLFVKNERERRFIAPKMVFRRS